MLASQVVRVVSSTRLPVDLPSGLRPPHLCLYAQKVKSLCQEEALAWVLAVLSPLPFVLLLTVPFTGEQPRRRAGRLLLPLSRA